MILVAMLTIPMLAMVAFSVDYGYLLKVRTDLQRCADATALAAVQDLIPTANGSQDLAAVRAAIRTYAAENFDNAFLISDADIEIGRFDPATIYSKVTLLKSGTYDAVRVTLRRDGQVNPNVTLFFAPILGIQEAPVVATSTAVLQKARIMPPGADVLPMAIPQNVWESLKPNDPWIGYGDGKMADGSGNEIPGNWGTLDIGHESNSTSDLGNQMVNGLNQGDLDSLYSDNRLQTNSSIDSTQSVLLEADTGISTGMKASVRAIHGKSKIVPIFDFVQGGGGNILEYHVVAWGVVEVVDSGWAGAKNTFVQLRKAYLYDGDLWAHADLGNTTDIIKSAYTSPVLVE